MHNAASTLVAWSGKAFLCTLALLLPPGAYADPAPTSLPLEALDRLCKPVLPCEISIDSAWQTTLARDARLPRKVIFHISAKGSWTINGAALDLAGSTIDAQPDHLLFPFPSQIHGLITARPEWFAPPNEGIYPPSAIARAFQAVDRTGTILLADHTYISPFFDPFAPDTCAGQTLTRPLTILGSHRPVPDDEHAPTRLLAGSILLGEVCGTAQLHLAHLGVDEGPYAVDHIFAGHAAYGIQLGNIGPLGSAQDTVLEDLSVLTTGLPGQHSVIVQGQRHPTLKDLWIWTLGGTHGLVLKSLDSRVDNIHCSGAASDCLILKSDYDTDHAGDASGTIVSNIFIHFLQRPGDTAGIQLEGKWDSLRHISLTNIHETGLNYGIAGNDSLFHHLADAQLTHWTAEDMRGPCLILNSGRYIRVTHFTCHQADPSPLPAIILTGADITLTDGQITCTGPACPDSARDGVADSGRHNTVDSLSGTNLGGFLVRTSPHAGGTSIRNISTHSMAGRTAGIYREPAQSWRQRLEAWYFTLKALLRIAWEKAGSTLHPA